MEAPGPTGLVHRRDIDGLRGFAVLAVVVFHFFPEWMPGGFVGVDVFFVISGFLISALILQDLGRGTFTFRGFYGRRVKRIFPALVVVLLASYALGWRILFTDEYEQLGKHIAASAGFVQNWALWGEAGYFDSESEAKPLLHLWSLGIEEQFYIVWPCFLWAMRKSPVRSLALTVLVAIASFGLGLERVGNDAVAAFYSPQTRFWELLSGSALAAATLSRPRPFGQTPAFRNALTVLGMAMVVSGCCFIRPDFAFPGTWALLPVVGTVFVIAAGPAAWLNSALLSRGAPVWFGLISYPLYLWHWPLLSLATVSESAVPGHAARLALVLLSIVLAWGTYRTVERPIRFGKASRNARTVPALVALMTVVGIVGYGTYHERGLAFRSVAARDDSPHAFEMRRTKQDPACLAAVGSATLSFCLASSGFAPSVVLIGDSHAAAIYEYVEGYFAKRGKGVLMLGKPGCPPFLDVERDEYSCREAMNEAVRYLADHPEIREVVLTARFAAAQSGTMVATDTPKHFYELRIVDRPEIRD